MISMNERGEIVMEKLDKSKMIRSQILIYEETEEFLKDYTRYDGCLINENDDKVFSSKEEVDEFMEKLVANSKVGKLDVELTEEEVKEVEEANKGY